MPCCCQNSTLAQFTVLACTDRWIGIMREVATHQHDQPGVGHDQRIRAHGDHRGQVLEEGLQLGVVRRDVDHHVEALAQCMGFLDAQGQVGVVEFVVAHAQAVARLAGVYRIGAVGEGVAHVFQGAGGGEQFGCEDGDMGRWGPKSAARVAEARIGIY